VALVLVKRLIERDAGRAPAGAVAALDVVFAVGVYLLAAGYGAHEVTNYLHVRFCADDANRLCEIVAFNDDEFSHWVFFAGFVTINVVLLALEALTPQRAVGVRDRALLVANALAVAAAIFANLALEETGADLPIIGAVALLAVALLVRRGVQPLALYYAARYGLGLVASVGYLAA